MPKVKSSKQYNMKVVAHRPWRRFLTAIAILFVTIMLMIVSFFAGQHMAVGSNDRLVKERDRLLQLYREQREQVDKLEQQVVNLKLAVDVDSQANNDVRSEVVELQKYIAKLEQDNAFYRGLMQPDPKDKGLVIDPPTITVSDVANTYRYNLIIKQIVERHQLVSGYLEVAILGKQGEETHRISLKDLSESIDSERIKLRFKYFQPIEGEIALPVDFVPEHLELKVVTQRPKNLVIDKKFAWTTKES